MIITLKVELKFFSDVACFEKKVEVTCSPRIGEKMTCYDDEGELLFTEWLIVMCTHIANDPNQKKMVVTVESPANITGADYDQLKEKFKKTGWEKMQ